MADRFTLLLIADASPEFPAALRYGGRLARALGARVLLTRITEPPDAAPWAALADDMRKDAAAAADALLRRFTAELRADAGLEADTIVREGEPKAEIRRLLEEDASIGLIVLAAGSGRDGPGPLVAALGRGHGFGPRAAPVLVVPGALPAEALAQLPALDPTVG